MLNVYLSQPFEIQIDSNWREEIKIDLCKQEKLDISFSSQEEVM